MINNSNKISNKKANDHQSQSDQTNMNAGTIDTIYEISRLLNCNLSREQLITCIQLIELGVSPAALATVIKENNVI